MFNNSNDKNNESAILRQGKLFDKTQKKYKGKNGEKTIEGMSGIIEEYNRWTNTSDFKRSNELLDESSELIKNEIEELNALEAEYNKIIGEYNTSTTGLMDRVDEYTAQVIGDKNINTNVFVGGLVNNPDASYEGCYYDKPSSREISMIPLMKASNNYTGKKDKDAYMCAASSVYRNQKNAWYSAYGAFSQSRNKWWHSEINNSHKYNNKTGNYEGNRNINYTDNYGLSKNKNGEWLWIKLPKCSNMTASSYEIFPRSGLNKSRAPNSWVILGGKSDCSTNWHTGGWHLLDEQTDQFFGDNVPNKYNIENPGDYNYYCIVVTRVGVDGARHNRNSVQFGMNYYYNTDTKMTNDDRSMIWDDGNYITLDQCKQKANDGGYKYFGLQDVQSNDKAACLVSNDEFSSKIYGDASKHVEHVSLWSSNTHGKQGVSMQITKEGNMVLTDAGGNVVFETDVVADCVQQYSTTDNTNSPGSDLKYLGSDLEQCKKQCDDLDNCALLVWNKGANKGCWLKSGLNVRRLQSYRQRTGSWWRRRTVTRYRWVGGTTTNNNLTIYTKTRDLSGCVFKLILQNDGNMCIYNVNDADSVAVWSTGTNGEAKGPRNEWKSSKGKYGREFISSTQGLSSGEWIGSVDGSLRLMMQTDGNLVLYTSRAINKCETRSDNKYGTPWVNAMYKLTPNGDTSVLGKLGYVDEDKNLSEYPNSMMTPKKTDDYQRIRNFDSAGNDIGAIADTTVEECKIACNANNNCNGFAFDKRNGINTCYPKDNKMYPVGSKQYLEGVDLYYSPPGVINDDSCNKDVAIIDSIAWNEYNKTGTKMTPETKCGLSNATSRERRIETNRQAALTRITDQIIEKLKYLETLNADMVNQMGFDGTTLEEYMVKYTDLNSKYRGMFSGSPEMDNISGILTDSDIILLQENYRYILWTIIATGLVVITLNQMRN